MTQDLLEKRAILALGGPIRLPEGFELPCRISKSTAGPGAGFGSASFAFGEHRVKKSISYTSGEFELVVKENGYALTRNGKPFLDSIEIIPVVRHCPEQAFFDLDPRCKFDCAFCSSPLLDSSDVKNLTAEKIMEMLDESMSQHDVQAISYTSGVPGEVDDTVDELAEIIRLTRIRYPDIPIGVEPVITDIDQIVKLKEAGADEIKINITTPRKDIFAKVCPNLDRDLIRRCLESAVEIFGSGNVTTNIIYGFGETDDELMELVEELCKVGVVPNLRALRINDYNRTRLESVLGPLTPVSPQRMLELATRQKDIMGRYGITMGGKTMCLRCRCCDLVPFKDL